MIEKILSPQQSLVLQHLVDGLVVKEISTTMNLSTISIRKHIKKAKLKLGAATQAQMIAFAVARGEVFVAMEHIELGAS